MQSLAEHLSPSHPKRRQQLLFVRYRSDGDLEARAELIHGFLPLAQALARRYDRRGEHLEDLTQVASLGLVKAVDRFDSELGVEFSSFAVPTILGELRRYFRDAGWAVHLPRAMQERVLALGRVVEHMSADLGASPTPGQIAAEMGLTVEEVLDAMVAAAGHDTVSYDAPAGRGDGAERTIADTMGEADEGLDLAEARPAVVRALRALPVRERRILYLRFAEDLTQSEIAQRLGISQMHVSRLIRTSLEELRVRIGDS